jgi:Icc-related predicted phosphoesterase
MKVLFFSDIHGDLKALKGIINKSVKAELVVCAGDLSAMGENLQSMIDELAKIRNKKILIIPGNNETAEMIEESIDDYKNIILIHGEIYQDKNITFAGLGGGSISPFNTIYELSEDEFKKKLEKFKNVDCLITHTPPKNTSLDLVKNGLHIGSGEIYKWIMNNNPRICCCGHVHENEGKEETLGKTLCFNAGKKGLIMEI